MKTYGIRNYLARFQVLVLFQKLGVLSRHNNRYECLFSHRFGRIDRV